VGHYAYRLEASTVKLQTSLIINVINKYVDVLLSHKFLLYSSPQNKTAPIMFHANKNKLPYVIINFGTVTNHKWVESPDLFETHDITSPIMSMLVYAPTTKYIFILIFKLCG
jgi:hypothetical protein